MPQKLTQENRGLLFEKKKKRTWIETDVGNQGTSGHQLPHRYRGELRGSLLLPQQLLLPSSSAGRFPLLLSGFYLMQTVACRGLWFARSTAWAWGIHSREAGLALGVGTVNRMGNNRQNSYTWFRTLWNVDCGCLGRFHFHNFPFKRKITCHWPNEV